MVKIMSFKRRSYVAIIVGSWFAILALMPVARPEAGARAWVRSLGEVDRQAYSQPGLLAELPITYRRALFGAAETPEERSSFWRAVVAEYQARSAHQADHDALLERVEALYSPAMFSAVQRSAEFNAHLAALRRQVRATLGEEAERTLFVVAGPTASVDAGLPLLERLRYRLREGVPNAWRRLQGTVMRDALAATCNCNPEFENEDCTGHQNCASPFACEEDTSWPACGTAWAHPCTKLCSFDNN